MSRSRPDGAERDVLTERSEGGGGLVISRCELHSMKALFKISGKECALSIFPGQIIDDP